MSLPVARRSVLTGGLLAAGALWGAELLNPPRALAVDDVILVRDCQVRASIVLAGDATAEEQEAARELIDHVRMITGQTLPIDGSGPVLIFLGQACPEPVADLADRRDAFRLAVEPGRIQIQGNVGRGVLAGAMRLLADLGVRWLDPRWTDARHRTALAVSESEIRDQPWWAYRTPTALWRYAPPLPNGPQQADEPAGYALHHRLTEPAFSVGGHGLPLVPRPDPKTEPYLFIKRKDGTLSPQIDVTHPEALTRALRGARELLAKNPAHKWLSIGPDDGLGFAATSWDAGDWDPLVGDISVTDRYVKFFNLMLADLQAEDPEVGIIFFAYVNYMRPPVREIPNARLIPMFAPITVDRIHTPNDPDGYERRYVLRLMEQWKALGVQPSTYSYLYNLADPGLPFSPLTQVMAELPEFARMGSTEAIRVEAAPGWGYDAPALYAAMNLMWDPQQDSDALMAEFRRAAYGPAADAINEHFDLLHRVYADTDWTAGSMYDALHILTENVMDRLDVSLRAAEVAVADAEEGYRARVGQVRLRYDYGQQLLAMMRHWRAGRFAEAAEAYDAAWEIGQRGARQQPVAVYPLRAQYQKWFWNAQVQQALTKTTSGNTLVAHAPDRWSAIIDNGTVGLADVVPTCDEALTWRSLSTNERTWSAQGLRYYYNGGVWYRTELTVPDDVRGRAIRVWIGAVDDKARCWINGHEAAPTGKFAGLAPWEFDGRGLIRYGESNVIVVRVDNTSLDEIGTGGIMGPVFLWAGEADDTEVRAAKPATEPQALTAAWRTARRRAAGLSRLAPNGYGVTRLPLDWQAIIDPSGTAIEVGLWEPGVGDNHWMPYRTDRIPADQGLAYYQGGLVLRARLSRVAGTPEKLWIACGVGRLQAWLNGVPLTRLRGVDGEPWEFAVPNAQEGDVLVIAGHAPDAAPGTGGLVGPVVLH
ncbi:DUF4838 domain-containing protein [Kribbella sp. NPDC050459]|uniref:DUF4838 domain-containing protein n=1 Tax=Kribbella sp. NPDC050459 TaxID=3155785 RepID=UPI0033E45960